jgi:hypothetical protein
MNDCLFIAQHKAIKKHATESKTHLGDQQLPQPLNASWNLKEVVVLSIESLWTKYICADLFVQGTPNNQCVANPGK